MVEFDKQCLFCLSLSKQKMYLEINRTNLLLFGKKEIRYHFTYK